MSEKSKKSGKFSIFHSEPALLLLCLKLKESIYFLLCREKKMEMKNIPMFFLCFQMTLFRRVVWCPRRRWLSIKNCSPASISSPNGRFTAPCVVVIWDVRPGKRTRSKCTRFCEWCSAPTAMSSTPAASLVEEKTVVNYIVVGVGREDKCTAAPVARTSSAKAALLRT